MRNMRKSISDFVVLFWISGCIFILGIHFRFQKDVFYKINSNAVTSDRSPDLGKSYLEDEEI